MIPVLQLDRETAQKLTRRLRKVTKGLGSIREHDVMLMLINDLYESTRYPPTALDTVRRLVEQERRDVRKRLIEKLPLDELRRVGRRLDGVVTALERDEAADARRTSPRGRTWRWAIDARVVGRAARLNSAIDSAGVLYLPDRLHDARIALKKLRYALEVATEASGSSNSDELRLLKQVQDTLGRLHDCQVLIERARRAPLSLGPQTTTAWRDLERFVDALETDCRRLHGRYMQNREAVVRLCRRLAGRTNSGAGRRASA
jgi:CHAD domain-containing protein